MADMQRFAALVLSFPVLAQSFREWTVDDGAGGGQVDLRALDAWAYREDPDGSEGIRDTAAFVLNLWSSHGTVWACGPFNLFRAILVWDSRQLAAFQAWVAAPWRP